ncbi:hypothetical protein AGMMS50267_01160 [Spirochaetia bacterium]|nr:hypothetical protein AGMMS50267_01160 [Spirochaetia bacterium]
MKKIVSVVLLGWIVFASCELNKGVLDFDKATFDREYAAWEASSIQDYRFTQEYFDDATGPINGVRITVKENTEPVFEIRDKWILENVPEEGWRWYYSCFKTTISDIYASIAETYTSAQDRVNKGEVATIAITYNTQYHYPEYVMYIIGHRGESVDGGEGWTLKITEFTPLPSGE